jgi:hypothetical protein
MDPDIRVHTYTQYYCVSYLIILAKLIKCTDSNVIFVATAAWSVSHLVIFSHTQWRFHMFVYVYSMNLYWHLKVHLEPQFIQHTLQPFIRNRRCPIADLLYNDA